MKYYYERNLIYNLATRIGREDYYLDYFNLSRVSRSKIVHSEESGKQSTFVIFLSKDKKNIGRLWMDKRIVNYPIVRKGQTVNLGERILMKYKVSLVDLTPIDADKTYEEIIGLCQPWYKWVENIRTFSSDKQLDPSLDALLWIKNNCS